MAEERDEQQFGKPGETSQDRQQQPVDQQDQPSELGQSQPQKPTDQQGQSASGQAELGQGGDTATLSGEQRGSASIPGSQSPGGTGGAQGGFVGSQGGSSSDYLREDGSGGGQDFASQGQGAPETAALEDEDIETGQPQSRESDIDGSSGNV